MNKEINGDIVYSGNSKELKPVTGVFDSFDLAGNLVISFYNEHFTMPNRYKITLDDDLSTEEFINPDDSSALTKEVVSTVVMNKKTAEFFKNWLEVKIVNNEEE